MSVVKMIGHAPFFIIIGLSITLAAASNATHPQAIKSLEEGARKAKQKNYDLAIRSLDQAVKTDPNHPGAYLERSMVRLKMLQPMLAIDDLRKVVDLDPSAFSAWKIMGDLYLSFRQKKDALVCYSQAYTFSASDELKAELKSLMENLSGDSGVTFDSTVDQSPLTAHELGRVISKPVLKQRAFPETVPPPDNKHDPHLEKNRAGFAGSPLSMDNLDESLEQFRKAVELEPNNAVNHEFLAQIYQIVGNYKEAIKHYENVLKIIPTHVDTMVALGDIYSISLNDNKMALYWYAMAIRNETDDTRKRSIADRISKFMAGG